MKHGAKIILPDGATYEVTECEGMGQEGWPEKPIAIIYQGESDGLKKFVQACSELNSRL